MFYAGGSLLRLDSNFRVLTIRKSEKPILNKLFCLNCVLKGIVHPKMKNFVIIYSPNCRSKPVYVSFLC